MWNHKDSSMAANRGAQEWTCCGSNCRDPSSESSHEVHSLPSGCHLIKLHKSSKSQRPVRVHDYPSSFSSLSRDLIDSSPSTTVLQTSLNEPLLTDHGTNHLAKSFNESIPGIKTNNELRNGVRQTGYSIEESAMPFVDQTMTAELFLTAVATNSSAAVRRKVSQDQEAQHGNIEGEDIRCSSTNFPVYNCLKDDDGELYLDLSKELAVIGARSPRPRSFRQAKDESSLQNSATGHLRVSSYLDESPLPTSGHTNANASIQAEHPAPHEILKLGGNLYEHEAGTHGSTTSHFGSRSVSYIARDTQRKMVHDEDGDHIERRIETSYAATPNRINDDEDSGSESSTDSDLASLMGSVEQARRRIQAYEESEKKLEQVAFAGDRSSLRSGLGIGHSVLATTDLTCESVESPREKLSDRRETEKFQQIEFQPEKNGMHTKSDQSKDNGSKDLTLIKKRDSLQRIAKSVSQILLQAPEHAEDERLKCGKESTDAGQNDAHDGSVRIPQLRCVAAEIQRNAELSATVVELREQLECVQSEMLEIRRRASVAMQIVSRVRRWRESCHKEDESKQAIIDSNGNEALRCLEDIETLAMDAKVTSWVDQRENKLFLMGKELEETRRERQRLELQGEMLRNEVAFLKSMNEKLKRRHDDDHTKAIETLKAHLEKQRESGTAVTAERDALRRELDKTRSHFAQQLAETEAMYATSEHELGALKHVSKLKQQEQEAVIKRLEEENQQLREQKEAAEAQLQSSLKAERLLELERQELQRKKDRLDAQHEALQQSLEDIRKRVSVTRNAADNQCAVFTNATSAEERSQAVHELCRVRLESTTENREDKGICSNNYTALYTLSNSVREGGLPSSTTMQLHLDNYTYNSKPDPSSQSSRAAFIQEYALGSALLSSEKGSFEVDEQLLDASAQPKNLLKQKSHDSALKVKGIDAPPAILQSRKPLLTIYEKEVAPSQQADGSLLQQCQIREPINHSTTIYTVCDLYAGKGRARAEASGNDRLHIIRSKAFEGSHKPSFDFPLGSHGVPTNDQQDERPIAKLWDYTCHESNEYVNDSRWRDIPDDCKSRHGKVSKKSDNAVEDAFRREICRVIQSNELLKKANESAEQENRELQRVPKCFSVCDTPPRPPTVSKSSITKAVHIGARRCDPFTGGASSGKQSITKSTANSLEPNLVFFKHLLEMLERRGPLVDIRPWIPQLNFKFDDEHPMDMVACSGKWLCMKRRLLRFIFDQFRTDGRVSSQQIIPSLPNDVLASVFFHGVIWGIKAVILCLNIRGDKSFKVVNAEDWLQRKDTPPDVESLEHTSSANRYTSTSALVGSGERLQIPQSSGDYQIGTNYLKVEPGVLEYDLPRSCRIRQPLHNDGKRTGAKSDESAAEDEGCVYSGIQHCPNGIKPENELGACFPEALRPATQCPYSPTRLHEDAESPSHGPSRCVSGSTETPDTWRVLTLAADVNMKPQCSDEEPDKMPLLSPINEGEEMPLSSMERSIHTPKSALTANKQILMNDVPAEFAAVCEWYGSPGVLENNGVGQNTLAWPDLGTFSVGIATEQSRHHSSSVSNDSCPSPPLTASPAISPRLVIDETEETFKLKCMQLQSGLVLPSALPALSINTPCRGTKGYAITLNRLATDSPRLGVPTCRRCEACMVLSSHRSEDAESSCYTASARSSPKKEVKDASFSHHISILPRDRSEREPGHSIQPCVSNHHNYNIKLDLGSVGTHDGERTPACSNRCKTLMPVSPALNGTVVCSNGRSTVSVGERGKDALQRHVKRSNDVNPVGRMSTKQRQSMGKQIKSAAVLTRIESTLEKICDTSRTKGSDVWTCTANISLLGTTELSTKPETHALKASVKGTTIQKSTLVTPPSKGTKYSTRCVPSQEGKKAEGQAPRQVAANLSSEERRALRQKRRDDAIDPVDSHASTLSPSLVEPSRVIKSQSHAVEGKKQPLSRSATPLGLNRASSGMHSATRALIRAASAPRSTAVSVKPPWDSSPAPRVNGPRVPLWALLRR